MMQSFHHQQQQLISLLSSALPTDVSASPLPSTLTPPSSESVSSSATGNNASVPTGQRDSKLENSSDSGRLAALKSLHRAIKYPPNSLLIAHSASYLSSGLWQLLSDKSYDVRQAGVSAYGALCAVVCSIPVESSGRQNHVMLGSLVDRFINWALPLLRHVSVRDGSTVLAVEGVREFVSVGDVNGIDRYALPILNACKGLLEDERTSIPLLNQVLGVLSLISSKFSSLFHPHFLDIVDMLLGWALVQDHADSDRQIVMDSFLHFQKHWVNNLDFSVGLLSKFLGDMDVLLSDGSQGTPEQFHRLLALLSCFLAILRSTASGLLENNLLDKMDEPLSKMLPRLLGCLSTMGQRFGWSKWIEDLWKCLTLLAEILREKFSTYYSPSLEMLFKSLEQIDSVNSAVHGKMTTFQIHGTLKTNLQLLSLQKRGLLSSCVLKLLQFESPISQLRLHPNHLITAGSSATYLFLLQHESEEVVQQAMELLMKELELLKTVLGESSCHKNMTLNVTAYESFSKSEILAIMNFDMKVLLSCVSLGGRKSLSDLPELAVLYLKRSEKLLSFVVEMLNPFEPAIDACLELQVSVVRMLECLATVELLSNCSVLIQPKMKTNQGKTPFKCSFFSMVIEHLRKYSLTMVKALRFSSPLAVKLVSLEWIQKFCENLFAISKSLYMDAYFCETFPYAGAVRDITMAVLDAAFDSEPKVRSQSVMVLELLLEVKLIHPIHFYSLAEILLEKLGDPDTSIKNAFIKLLSHLLPATQYTCGMRSEVGNMALRPQVLMIGNGYLHWKQVFALKQPDQHFHSQQLVSVLNYVSQRWKVPFASWIQGLIYAFRGSKDTGAGHPDENLIKNGWLAIKAEKSSIERICLANNLAGAWWAVHEAARFCVSTRLRTNFGGPAQTFAALERMLLDITTVLQVDSQQTDGTLNILGSSGAHLLPMRLLLDFVEALKKNVYNAYEGTAVLSSAPPQSVLFFRANRKVCEEWFSRISEPMMNAGMSLQSQDATVEYCTLRLEELKSLATLVKKDKSKMQALDNAHNPGARISSDISRILRHMSLALCQNHDTHALLGIHKWVAMNLAPLVAEESDFQKNNGELALFPWITGLVYQSEGRYEKAAAYYAHLLEEEDCLSSMGSDDIQFVIERIIESYTSLSDWKSLESWLLELQALRARHAGKSFSGSLTAAGNEINAIQALAHFDEGDIQAAWTCLDLTPKTSAELSLDPKLALQRSEQMLLQAMLFQAEGNAQKVPQTLQRARTMLDETSLALSFDGLSETAPYATQLHCLFAFEEGHQLRDSEPKQKHNNLMLSSCVWSLQSMVNRIHRDCRPWLKVLRIYRTILPTSWVTLKLCMDLFGFARKQENYLLANHLKNYLNDHVSSCAEVKLRDFLISNLQYQGALLTYAENRVQDAVVDLWSFVQPEVTALEPVCLDAGVAFLKAKACLKLAIWLKGDDISLDLENVVLKMSADFNRTEVPSSVSSKPLLYKSLKPSMKAISEEMIGTVTKVSTQLCSAMGKSWISYASWCFRQATESFYKSNESTLHSFSFSSILAQELKPGRFHLTEDEAESVESAVMQVLQKDDCKDLTNTGQDGNCHTITTDHSEARKNIKTLQQQVIETIENAAAAPAADDCGWDSLSVHLASQLTDLLLSGNDYVEDTDIAPIVNRLIEVWRSLRKRRVSLYGHSALGFTHYLRYSSKVLQTSEFTGVDYDPLNKRTDSHTLRSTLYILHILLNYGVELKDTLRHALSIVPLEPWQELTPQLFARLSSHPDEVVRKEIEGLLIMLAKLCPSSIVYPTLVDVNACDEKPSEELLHVKACLTELYPRLIQDVQLMINELGNVTVLWEELWLSTLQDLHMDVIRRINLLKEEAARVSENVTLSQTEKNKINAAKYSAMMAPIVVALERRLASTSRKPETPHEVWFYEEYIERIKSAILTFKTPPLPSALGEVWRPFDSIAASLASHQKKSSISLKEVAPSMSFLSSCNIPMPGLEKQSPLSESDTPLHGIVTISSLSDHVTILPTKTRPKKLIMFGSDGKKYIYLLKGREDLRLDARIMQLLQAINSFFCSSRATDDGTIGIRYYSVTPISGRAGLIQWVDNVISIYSIFRSWQTRVKLAQMLPSVPGGAKSPDLPPVPRPSDMFYGKIIPALKEKGIRRVISRRDWPHDVKRKVLLDLMSEVPKQLLHQELWCASEGFKAFTTKFKRYSGSVAAMSIVGHMLGLGDRHLDNILMDFCSGDVVHIDYNVCFDKGQRLKVPEIVPFRLTQTMEAALGLTGVEGTFRANCEAVLGVLRKNKDILLMLMEVFVWDPLVEWTRGNFHDDAAIGGEERKDMEVAVSLSLFSSRVQEIRVRLQEHHDLLLATLPAAELSLERFSEVLNQYEIASSVFLQADQERAELILREASAKKTVAEAACNSEKIRASFEIQAHEFSQAKALVSGKAQETAVWMEQRGRILGALRRNMIPEITAPTVLTDILASLSLTSAVLVAGVPVTVVPEPTQAQCNDIDAEISLLVNNLSDGLSSALTALQTYSLALQRILPLNYHTTSRVYDWAQVLQLAAHALSSDILSLAKRQAGEQFSKIQGGDFNSVRNCYNDLCLKVEKYADDVKKMEVEYAELSASIGMGPESKAKDRLFYGLINYMQSPGLVENTNAGVNLQDSGKKTSKALAVLHTSISSLYDQLKEKVHYILNASMERRERNESLVSKSRSLSSNLEAQVEMCMILVDFLNEVKYYVGQEIPNTEESLTGSARRVEENWALVFHRTLLSSKILVAQMTEVVVPDVLKTYLFCNSDLMDAFGLISQIRGSIDAAFEHLIEIKVERDSLVELEQNYFQKVSNITEGQLALEKAALKSREHLSWEEAEEFAAQEEAFRTQLDQLHQSWGQREFRISSLIKKEAQVKNALILAEKQFQLLTNADECRKPNDLRSSRIMVELVKPFSELEQLDKTLSSLSSSAVSMSDWIPAFGDILSCGQSLSENIWRFRSILKDHSFFIWKLGIIDSFLDLCIHDASPSVDQTLGFEQLILFMKKKFEFQLQERVDCYLAGSVAPAFLSQLDKENERLKHISEENSARRDQVKPDYSHLKQVHAMLEEYCNAHETAREAKSAASRMKKQVKEVRDALRRTSLDIVQMEWMNDATLTPSQTVRTALQQLFASDDNLHPIFLDLKRPKLLETIHSAIPQISRSIERLQACEQNSLAAEGQLERAMGWACGGPSSVSSGNSSAKMSGIPTEFHDHLLRRQQLLWDAREKASNIAKICMSLLEFEASRDGIFRNAHEALDGDARFRGDSRSWQKAYLDLVARLEVTYQSFTHIEQEWKLAQSSLEAASTGLYSATNELSIASVKAKSASGDLQSTILSMRDCTYEVSAALSSFSRVSRGHTALTTETGAMLEEVLAITEDLHDVHSLGKEAATFHRSLMDDLLKANAILTPLDSALSKDVALIAEAMTRESETNIEVSSVHGQAIYQSYGAKIRESYQNLRPLVPSTVYSVKGLYSMLTRLAQIASVHARNLNKALEEPGESEEAKSQESAYSGADLTDNDFKLDELGEENHLESVSKSSQALLSISGFSLEDKGWMSSPDSVYSSGSESNITLAEASSPASLNNSTEMLEQTQMNEEESNAFKSSTPSSQSNCDDISDSDQQVSAEALIESNDDCPRKASVEEPGENTEFKLPASDVALKVTTDVSQPLVESPELESGRKKAMKGKFEVQSDEASPPTQTQTRVTRGKNAYALSVLKCMEMKIDGRGIADNREVSIPEQVDYLIKQATSVDNLCNMYEGWTPWI
ncbi:serine/threonine-protein kinase SMG1 [Arabidopsis lyrata subsp. lyrata]|uniref:serine/threonine-protein kinase SMG1 n=1 Tax=Arabidopsis lyrata subsp. lyrata TaxID=81972 RepID=UPI000A29C6B9|nr:serine/threonine-protein kinase SMG1 [Arabidopsis lyrata subsp. lyrata]|eukprot:XP_020886986.1 serine/threonine-protein kinase SMG1 [Arabidopsis lyrata subsp. lyrata]